MSTEVLSEQAFEKAADASLQALDEALGDLDGLEASLQLGVLKLEFPDGATYVINSHRAARQIWMAAEQNAWHFDYRPAEDRWVASRSGDELWAAVEAVMSRKLGRPLKLR
jgi:CyaY protein